ncbi:uncharacterized protein LOC111632640 isoform X1 [Centruroides sculpturatus]|uniref:uncharacterized protein LOC111632640 isoform X1 n=1 Tax=Centruroides sculpturatus TaxID=218467 RepID=UPI000C6E7B85|nr:uncharacterized protein LOC111632640 isoform X1 [Centruroides sculpturatus]
MRCSLVKLKRSSYKLGINEKWEEIPHASSFANPRKVGYLKRLTGKGWIYSGCWKERYCVLDSTKLYFYESRDSQGREKTAGVISLDYYDLCEEGNAKDNRRASNVFAVGTSVRGFFDNRHLFSADTQEEREEWIAEIRDAIEDARGGRSRAGRTRASQGKGLEHGDGLSHNSQENLEIDVPSSDLLFNITKERTKGPTGRRLPQRKSMMTTTKKTEIVPQRSNSLSALNEIAEDQEIHSEDDGGNVTENEESVLLAASEIKLCKSASSEHNAFLQELEMRVGAGKRHSSRTAVPPKTIESESELETVKNDMEVMKSRMTVLVTHVEHVERNVTHIQKDLNKIQQQVVCGEAKGEKLSSQTDAMEKRLNSALEEMHAMCENAKQALQEARDTKNEYYNLKEEFRELLLKIRNDENKAIMELLETI